MKQTKQPIYNNLQRIFCLNYLANISALKSGSQEDIQEFTANAIRIVLDNKLFSELSGHWNMVWGPCVFQNDNTQDNMADNTMYVARNDGIQGHPQYVIAIAGSMSVYDYFVEDFKVSKMIDWDSAEAQRLGLKPRISEGTSIGLDILANSDRKNTMQCAGRNILEFLEQIMREHSEKNEEVEIVVTGHSLGGALSAALALYLADRKSEWDRKRYADFTVVPTAGPPVGNYDFSIYYDTQLGGRVTRLWNSIDLIPHLWDKLDTAMCLYVPDFPPGNFVQLAISLLKLLTGRNVYTQIMKQAAALPGRVVNLTSAGLEKPDPASLGEDVANFFNFLAQVFYQHTIAYISQMGLIDFTEILRNLRLDPGILPSTKDEKFKALCDRLSGYSKKISEVIQPGRK